MKASRSRVFSGAAGVDGRVDFAHAGHENEHVAGRAGIDDAFHHIRGLFGDRAFVVAVQVTHLHRKTLAFGNQNGARGIAGCKSSSLTRLAPSPGKAGRRSR